MEYKMITNLFLVNIGITCVDSIDFPGYKISHSWRIAKSRVMPGERIGFVKSWTTNTHMQGVVLDKVNLGNRYAIIFKPDDKTIIVSDIDIKNRFTEKNYIS